ncbi:tyrosine-type recombinase/integrase [Faecalicatena contorta]|uniref:tyrosine-type recombinase/integrase n=1 Tax=Faecalicatena contorta TaxID=39482 RepID=UPI00196087C0|nr:tyrosine-type recombinase/integrase [Faecalicatena contorta]MBM6686919.1 tyrosine-type recombinase/integrase [Faecalicatena contorta]MBM6710083.1 tyrosine-type recombinase/integrase [Faecalicatena contorta]
MEQQIMDILRKMQDILTEKQLKELYTVLQIQFEGCIIIQKREELSVPNKTWERDLENYLMSKILEGKSPATINRYKYELQRLLSYINKDVSDILSKDISNYLRAYKNIKKVANQTLKNVRAVFNSFFTWLRDRNIIKSNPVLLVEGIKVEKKIKKPYTDEERERMFRNCKTVRDRAMIEFLYSTAIRVSELAALNISDIHFSSNDLIVYGKGGKERIVYLNDRSNMYLKEYLKTRTDNNPALFVSLKAPYERLHKEGIESRIKKLGTLSGVQKAHPHRFRRTALTNALNRGMPLQEAMILAGHSKPETTMCYCTINQEGVRYHHKKYLSA